MVNYAIRLRKPDVKDDFRIGETRTCFNLGVLMTPLNFYTYLHRVDGGYIIKSDVPFMTTCNEKSCVDTRQVSREIANTFPEAIKKAYDITKIQLYDDLSNFLRRQTKGECKIELLDWQPCSKNKKETA